MSAEKRGDVTVGKRFFEMGNGSPAISMDYARLKGKKGIGAPAGAIKAREFRGKGSGGERATSTKLRTRKGCRGDLAPALADWSFNRKL